MIVQFQTAGSEHWGTVLFMRAMTFAEAERILKNRWGKDTKVELGDKRQSGRDTAKRSEEVGPITGYGTACQSGGASISSDAAYKGRRRRNVSKQSKAQSCEQQGVLEFD